MMIAWSETVFEDKRRHATIDEPLRDLFAFVVVGEAAITAAGADDDGRPVGLFLRGEPNRDRRLVRILSPLRPGARGPE